MRRQEPMDSSVAGMTVIAAGRKRERRENHCELKENHPETGINAYTDLRPTYAPSRLARLDEMLMTGYLETRGGTSSSELVVVGLMEAGQQQVWALVLNGPRE